MTSQKQFTWIRDSTCEDVTGVFPVVVVMVTRGLSGSCRYERALFMLLTEKKNALATIFLVCLDTANLRNVRFAFFYSKEYNSNMVIYGGGPNTECMQTVVCRSWLATLNSSWSSWLNGLLLSLSHNFTQRIFQDHNLISLSLLFACNVVKGNEKQLSPFFELVFWQRL